MILSNFLSIQKHHDSKPHEIISISFNMQSILQTRYYNLGDRDAVKLFNSDITASKILQYKTTRSTWHR